MPANERDCWRILLVDDDEEDFILTRHMLNLVECREVLFEWAPSYEDGVRLLASNLYHAVLVDYDLGAKTGIELIRAAVAQGYPSPLILYSGRSTYDTDVAAMEAGATLYLSKGEASPLLLERTLRYAIEHKELQKERDRLLRERSEILESIQDGFLSIDRSWRIIYINRQAARNSGQAPEQLVGKDIWEAYPGLEQSPLAAHYRQVMEGHAPSQLEMRGLYRDAWYNINVYPSADGITVYWQDISERKKAEEALSESENKFSLLFEKAAFAAALSNLPDGAFVDVNEAWVNTFGFSREETIGKNSLALGINPDEEARPHILARLEEFGRVRNLELPLHTKSGDLRYMSMNIDLIDIGGERYILNTTQDITERVKAQALLQESHLILQEANQRLQEQAEELEVQTEELQMQTEELEVQTEELRTQTDDLAAMNEKLVEQISMLEPANILVTDMENRITFWNQGTQNLYGFTKAEAIGKVSYQLLRAVFPQPLEEIKEQLYANGSWEGQATNYKKDGSQVVVAAHWLLYQDKEKQPKSIIKVFHDITRLAQAETASDAINQINAIIHSTLEIDEVMQQALKAAAQTLRCDTATISLRKDNRWIVSYVDGFHKDVIGLEMDDIQERHVELAIQTRQPVAVSDAFKDERFNREYLKAWGIRSVLVIPILLRSETVGVFFFNYQQERVEFTDFHIGFGIKLAATVSLALENARLYENLKKELAERKQAEEELRKVNEYAAWLARFPGENPNPVARIGLNGTILYSNLSAARLPGWAMQVGNMAPEPILQMIRETIAQDREVVQDISLGEREYSFSMIPILSEPYINLYGRDVTKRRRAEQALVQANHDLNIYAEQLYRSNESLRDFAFIASHDLQEPMRKVQSFGDRLEKKYSPLLGDEGLDYLRRMQSAAKRMQTMLDGLLTYSRIETQGQPFGEVDLKKVAEEVVSDLDERILETGGRVEIGELPVIDADPVQMRQLLLNLVGNALKFLRPGVAPVVTVFCRPSSEGQIELNVEDNGIGFDMCNADTLFKPFRRLHGRSEYPGSGMGLAICKKIVERHGGTITVRSVPGEGTTFTVTMPVKQKE